MASPVFFNLHAVPNANFSLTSIIGTLLAAASYHFSTMPCAKSSFLNNMFGAPSAAALFHLCVLPHAKSSLNDLADALLMATLLPLCAMHNANSFLNDIIGFEDGCSLQSSTWSKLSEQLAGAWCTPWCLVCTLPKCPTECQGLSAFLLFIFVKAFLAVDHQAKIIRVKYVILGVYVSKNHLHQVSEWHSSRFGKGHDRHAFKPCKDAVWVVVSLFCHNSNSNAAFIFCLDSDDCMQMPW